MSFKVFLVLCLVKFVLCEEIKEKNDSVLSGTDFIPQIQSFQFPPQPVFANTDLTALQQTHVLGNFHHRFHPPRVGFRFGVNHLPLVFTPQTHIIPPQPQDQRSLQRQPLRQHEILQPPSPQQEAQQSVFSAPQQHLNPPPNFKPLSNQKPQHPFGSTQDESIKNSFPSNAPHTIKFSISSQNYSPNQVKQYINPSTPAPKITHQLTASLSPGRFFPGQQTQLTKSLNQASSASFPQQTNFGDASKTQQNNFQNFNIQSKPTFGPTQTPTRNDLPGQFNVNLVHSIPNVQVQQGNDISSGSFINKHVSSSGNNNFDTQLTDSQLKYGQSTQLQTSNDFGQNSILQQAKINQQQQLFQPNYNFVQTQSQSPNVNILQQTPHSQFLFNSAQQQQQNFIQPSAQPQFKFPSTEIPQLVTSENSLQSQETNNISPSPSRATIPQSNDLVFQKSHEQTQYTLSSDILNQQKNEISSSPVTPTAQIYRASTARVRNSKPIVKEIRINLNDKGVPTSAIPPQLYIKEDRQKEFLEIKEKEQKEQRLKKEKSQEDLINEQIQKLLQSHNLEIIDKDNDSQTDSQEAQISKFTEQFKKYNYSVQLLNGGSLLSEIKPKQKIVTTAPPLPPLPDLPEHIKKQYDIKLVRRDELFKQFDLPSNHKLTNDSSNIFLANGQQLELVKFTKDGLMDKIPIGIQIPLEKPTTTSKPPKILFEELTKGVIPPGVDYELIRHKGDGRVEKVKDLASAKKVTFVFLEEQPDGSVKIQGVKGNTNQEVEEDETVDSLIKKIKDGSLKLPPSNKPGLLTNEIPRVTPITEKNFVTFPPFAASTTRSVHNYPPSAVLSEIDSEEKRPSTEFTFSSPYSVNIGPTYSSVPYLETSSEPPTTSSPNVNYVQASTRKQNSQTRIPFLPTVPSIDSTLTPTFGSKRLKSTTSSLYKTTGTPRKIQKSSYPKTTPKYSEEPEYVDSEILNHKSTEYNGQRLRVPQDVVAEESNLDPVRPLNDILKENNLHEMAKFLDQSGLDTILNETGPYTIFIPTDKAFKTLESQLGGPDRAEDKFRENPRLLSGLLLHHVVPGSFRLEDLQDEMTGVSLAGTQLRVNIYTSEEKNLKNRLITINGAKVSNEKKDIAVPQGLAHAIDRVLFPLPVGDIVQTLRGDRERRFTKFLRILEYSGLMDVLTGSKTYTVFAPTDKAFSVLSDSELENLMTNREAAKTNVLRHLVPGTLYSAGMSYFQVKDSMEEGQKIVIKKELGKIKANSAQIISANIPATNGVIHAVESLL